MRLALGCSLLFVFSWPIICCTHQPKDKNVIARDSVTIANEIAVINQTLRYLDPKEPVPNWDSPFHGVMSQGLEGEPVWVGFMSGVFMPPSEHFDKRVEQMDADWNSRFRGIDTVYRAVFHKLLDFRNPDFLPKIDSLTLDKRPKRGPDDVIWKDWKGFPAFDTYNIYAFTTPAWLELHEVVDEKILRFPYRKLGTLSISHIAFSADQTLACYLYDMWGYSVHKYGVVFARKVNGKWKREGDHWLSIS